MCDFSFAGYLSNAFSLCFLDFGHLFTHLLLRSLVFLFLPPQSIGPRSFQRLILRLFHFDCNQIIHTLQPVLQILEHNLYPLQLAFFYSLSGDSVETLNFPRLLLLLGFFDSAINGGS